MSSASDDDARTQAAVCARHGSPVCPVDDALRMGVALGTLDRMPITAVRLRPEGGTNGWYVHGGDASAEPDFYAPVHTAHVRALLPLVVPYLALAPGYKAILDDEGYEDVWFEPLDEGSSRGSTGFDDG